MNKALSLAESDIDPQGHYDAKRVSAKSEDYDKITGSRADDHSCLPGAIARVKSQLDDITRGSLKRQILNKTVVELMKEMAVIFQWRN